MNISFKRDMTHNYMVLEFTQPVYEDDYRIRMLMENHIRGLLPCSLKKVDCQSRFFYDITSRQSMAYIYENNSMDEQAVCTLLQGLYRALKEVKKYLLDMDKLVLEPDMIYMDIETREPFFCYLPGYQGEMTESFRKLTAYLLEHLERRDDRAVLLAYEVYRKAREENYSLERILQEAQRPAIQEAQSPAFRQSPVLQKTEPFIWREAQCPDPYSPPPGREDPPGKKRQEEAEPKAKPPSKEQKKTQKRQRAKRTKNQNASGRIFLAACFGIALLLLGVAAWFWRLTVTQIGGVVFLLAAVLIYGFSSEGKRKTGKQTKEERELAETMEQFTEEPFCFAEHPIYRAEAPAAKKRERGTARGKTPAREEMPVREEIPAWEEIPARQKRPAPDNAWESAGRLGDTGVLFEAEESAPRLMLSNLYSQEHIVLEKDRYIVGKLPGQSDIVLAHPSVSRVHARIERKGAYYYLCDLNSTNGTFLNGRRLDVNERALIQPADEIAFARVSYQVGRC